MPLMAASHWRPRKNFQKIRPRINPPGLIDVQLNSYKAFLQEDTSGTNRKDRGLQAVFNLVFPITAYSGNASVEFVSYSFGEPKYEVDECRLRGMSFAATLKVIIRLVVWNTEGEKKVVKDIKEQEVYFGEIPLMTDNGTFIINGIERVVVSQLHRSAGVFFDQDKSSSVGGKLLFTARVIPYRGSWVDFEFDTKNICYVRIDRRRKTPVTTLIKALGYSDEFILDYFYEKDKIVVEQGEFNLLLNFSRLRGQRLLFDVTDPKTNDIIIKKGRRLSIGAIKKLEKAKIVSQRVDEEYLLGKVLAVDLKNTQGDLLLPINTELEAEHIEQIKEAAIGSFEVLCIDDFTSDSSLRETLLSDKTESSDDALKEIYKKLRPGDPPVLETAKQLFNNIFFNPDRYDLSVVGRVKLNEKLGLKTDLETRVLTKEDILETVKYLLKLKVGQGEIDDIDNLGNRRIRAVGELLENQYRIGLLRLERAVKERLQVQDVETLLPHDFINNKPVSALVKEFFGSGQLSQFMDQTNPLSEITHKRRLSALGPGGLTRDRAGFEVRDVHPTHYGRICPVETPEGPNIGLISSLAVYAKVNDFGFIETPYSSMKETDDKDIKYYTAAEEAKNHVIAQASDAFLKKKPDDYISVRRKGETETVRAEEADLADVATTQLVSVAANLIPFLQNDDANRVLMGSNMMRQAVPLMKTSAPLVGTGMERIVARDSGACVVAKRTGVVASIDAERIVVKVEEGTKNKLTEVGADVDIYTLKKYRRSNLDTCINQVGIVRVGEKVKAGDILADGFATDLGELALGQNVTAAFMTWNGYNFEDSILISERVVKEDLYTSVHIQGFECISRDTKLGQEEITADIPNIGEEALLNLDETGIIRIGAEVKSGDILVGKITPKGETQLSPEEKLLRAIFGEKAGDVRDSSLYTPPGVNGVVIGCKVFSRVGADKDARSIKIFEQEKSKLVKDEQDKIEIIKESAKGKILNILKKTTLAKTIKKTNGDILVKEGEALTSSNFDQVPYTLWFDLVAKDAKQDALLSQVLSSLQEKINQIKHITKEKLAKISKGDELPPGVIKMVKVYIAIKRKLKVGDKMAGRHGNKGVISRILPEQDMPYMADGTPVDIVLNPLGVPSRMNVGQILETHLGWAAHNLGKKLNEAMNSQFNRKELENMCLSIWEEDSLKEDIKSFVTQCSDEELKDFIKKQKDGLRISTPIFDGANEKDISGALKKAGVAESGRTVLYDGLTGERFHNPVTVGVMYVLKLHHLADEKIHARSIGPYSLVTQQPLGGKAQFGGQRLGEMEVWAMEAYGAAHTLQEMLTVKSDDVYGRTRMYESIIKGANTVNPGIPESFNVLVKELQSLSLDINLLRADGQEFDVSASR